MLFAVIFFVSWYGKKSFGEKGGLATPVGKQVRLTHCLRANGSPPRPGNTQDVNQWESRSVVELCSDWLRPEEGSGNGRRPVENRKEGVREREARRLVAKDGNEWEGDR